MDPSDSFYAIDHAVLFMSTYSVCMVFVPTKSIGKYRLVKKIHNSGAPARAEGPRERSTIAKKKWYIHRVDFSWTDTGIPRVRTFPSVLPSGRLVPPQETHNSLEKEEKKLQNIC